MAIRAYAPKIIHKTHVANPLPVSQERRQEYLAKLDRELVLTPEQRQKVESILAASQERMKALWEQIEPKTKEEYRNTRKEISEILSPEQREKMKRLRHTRDQEKSGEPKAAPGPGEKSGDPKPEACLGHAARKKC